MVRPPYSPHPKSSLIKHKRTMMKADGAPDLSCTICDLQLCTGKAVKSHHIFVHRKQFTCKICGQSFTLKKSLELHVKNRVSISCQDCGNIFCNKRAHNGHSYAIHGKYFWINWSRLYMWIFTFVLLKI